MKSPKSPRGWYSEALKSIFATTPNSSPPSSENGTTTNTTNSTTIPTFFSSSSTENSTSKVPAIVGGVLGGLVFLAVLGATYFLLQRRRRQSVIQHKQAASPQEMYQPPDPQWELEGSCRFYGPGQAMYEMYDPNAEADMLGARPELPGGYIEEGGHGESDGYEGYQQGNHEGIQQYYDAPK
ncbi:hypothetical protein BDZ91DRAFT_710316 [Kalaharituber pfeilii]|nr:hypothetical protein BDZ91DRAFT_710316 [Kalaharituber pfeilii]